MKSPKITFGRIDCLDNLEWMCAPDYSESFPTHFHDCISLTLIQQGLERTDTKGKTLLSPPGSFSLTPHDEVHANPNINEGSYSFTTFYISPEVFAYFINAKYFSFRERTITNPYLYQQLLHFTQEVKHVDASERITNLLRQLVLTYVQKGGKRLIKQTIKFNIKWAYELINERLDEKIPLDYLAQKMGVSKYVFLRTFKNNTGITPGQFISIKRIERGKKLIREGYPLVEAALAVGFCDQSHFHRHFKQLVGVTPRSYQQACNIIQE